MSEYQGELRLVGKAHGVDNYLLTWYDEPDNWEFRQFTSQPELDKFVDENDLLLIEQMPSKEKPHVAN